MKVFYRPEQACHEAKSFSPSAGKPALVIQDWLTSGIITNDDIVSFEPLQDGDLAKSHDPYYVAGVLSGRVENGFGNTNSAVAHSLSYTTGSFAAAAKHALEHNEHVCSPTSGFHHAHWNHAQGFCTFNGLVIAAQLLRRDNPQIKVGILDCDHHYGDGTASIIQRKQLDYIQHHTQGSEFHMKGDAGPDGKYFFEWLIDAISKLQGCDIILYQAGADPHINDPLGGILTTEQLEARDRIVFQAFKDKPLCWNLAGGYQRDLNGSISPVLEIHRNTAKQCNQ